MLKTNMPDVLCMPKTATASEPDSNDDVEERARKRALDTLELPGHGYEMAATRMEHRNALRDMVLLLQEHGLATREELRECYDPTGHNEPQQGLYADRQQWWREVGEPNLRVLPGVEAPDAAGDCWRFVGVA